MRFRERFAVLGAGVLVTATVMANPAGAAVRINRAELSGTRLRLEGTALPNRTITANGVAIGTSDGAGNFKLQKDPFAKPADCRVTADDGSGSPVTAALAGCTTSSPPPPPPSSQPTLSSLKVEPADVIGGQSATGTIALSAAAPTDGFTVSVSSDNPTAANAPASVTVPAGATSATFPVTTNALNNSQSALIIGTAGDTTVYSIITVWTEFAYSHGSIGIVPGGGGSGRITSQPAGIDCTITRGNGAGACTAFFTVGTVVRLDARPAADSSFVGWRALPGCFDASKVIISRGANISCQPGFVLR